MSLRIAFVVLLLAALALAACDSEAPDLQSPRTTEGTATLSVLVLSDSSTTTFDGTAAAAFENGALVRLSFLSTDSEGRPTGRSLLVTATRDGVREPGPYFVGNPLQPGSGAVFVALYTDTEAATGSLPASEGLLTIETFSATEVRGTIRMETSGRPITEDGPTQYVVEGTFEVPAPDAGT